MSHGSKHAKFLFSIALHQKEINEKLIFTTITSVYLLIQNVCNISFSSVALLIKIVIPFQNLMCFR